jgi:hypothetical protein
MTDFAALQLGQDNQQIVLESSEDNRAASIALVKQCKRHLDITTRLLDPAIYDDDEFLEALKALATRSRYSRIRIMMYDSRAVVARGHRLLEIANQLSSFISLRQPGPDHQQFNEAWLIADTTGVIRRPLSDRYEGIVNFNDEGLARELDRQFKDLWEHGREDPNLRRLML